MVTNGSSIKLENQLVQMIEASLDAIIGWTIPEGIITFFNHAAEELYGYSAAEMIGKPVELLATYLNRQAQFAETLKKISNKQRFRSEATITCKDGSEKRVDGALVPIIDEAGTVISVVCVIRDVTEQYMAMEHLARLANIVHNSNDAKIGWLLDNYKVIVFNPAAEKLMGINAELIMGNSILSLVRPIGREDRLLEIMSRIKTEADFRFEGSFDKPDKTTIFLDVAISQMRDRRNALVGVLAVVRDISERKLAELQHVELQKATFAREQAEEMNRLKDRFLAVISHELRTPLNAIFGWSHIALDTLNRQPLDRQKLQEGLEIIERNAKAQTQLIDDLLDISRIISGNLRLQRIPTHVRSSIEFCLSAARPTAENKNITIQASLEQGLTVLADAERLQQIFSNLLANAIKFTPAGGVVKITSAKRGTKIYITIEDTGIGIKPEFLPYVFDSFRQAESSLSRRHGGLGLGLTIVKGLVEYHEGEISAESLGENKGAKFTVSLPALTEKHNIIAIVEKNTSTKPTLPSLEGMKILVVEDDTDTRKVVVLSLERQGAVVTEAPSALHGKEELRKNQFSIIVSDIEMPYEDGYTFMQGVRKDGISIPAIALTAHARAEDRLKALQAGFQVHITKPVNLDELINIISILIAQKT